MACQSILILVFLISGCLWANVGAPCQSNASCARGEQCILEFKAGYCARFDCSAKNPCDLGAKCVEIEGENFTVCLKKCSQSSDCRAAYACHDGGVCLAVDP